MVAAMLKYVLQKDKYIKNVYIFKYAQKLFMLFCKTTL
jgi:hypothetical protein